MTTFRKIINVDYAGRLPMKRLVSTLACTLVMLIWIANPVQAQSQFKGTLEKDLPLTVTFAPGTADAGSTPYAVTYLRTRDQSFDLGC